MNRRGWLRIAVFGCALVVLVMLVSALVIVDKEHFGWLVGRSFLGVIVAAVMVGAIAILVAVAMLPERKSWRGITLLAWGLIALTSPAFGFLFLLPWGVLALSLPVVVVALVDLFRGTIPN